MGHRNPDGSLLCCHAKERMSKQRYVLLGPPGFTQRGAFDGGGHKAVCCAGVPMVRILLQPVKIFVLFVCSSFFLSCAVIKWAVKLAQAGRALVIGTRISLNNQRSGIIMKECKSNSLCTVPSFLRFFATVFALLRGGSRHSRGWSLVGCLSITQHILGAGRSLPPTRPHPFPYNALRGLGRNNRKRFSGVKLFVL